MPFRSKAQRRYLWATNPALAAEFERKTGRRPLPERAKPKPKSKRKRKA